MRKRASAGSQALPSLKVLTDEFVFDLAFAFETLDPGIRTETVDADVALFAFDALFASGGLVKRTANLYDVAPSVVVDAAGLIVIRLGVVSTSSSSVPCLLLFELLRTIEQRGNVEVVQRQRIHHFAL